jgi:hypothetical protein
MLACKRGPEVVVPRAEREGKANALAVVDVSGVQIVGRRRLLLTRYPVGDRMAELHLALKDRQECPSIQRHADIILHRGEISVTFSLTID